MEKPLIEEVFEKAGGRQKLRSALRLSKQTMCDWARYGYVPSKHCMAVHKLTGVPLKRLMVAADLASQHKQAA